jgi:tetratricopeptide (TPR) repeat protein
MKAPVVIFLAVLIATSQCLSAQTAPPLSRPAPEEFDWDHEIAVADDAYNDGNYIEAERHYRKSLDIAEQLHLTDAQRATSLASVAQALRYQKKFAEAEPLFRQALTIREKVLPANHPRTALTLEGLGACRFAADHLDEAETYFLRALAIRDRLTGDDDNACAHGKILQLLGRTYFRQGKQEKAQAMYERAFAIWVEAKEKCTIIASVMNDLGTLYTLQGKLKSAEEMYASTIPMMQKELGDEQPELVAQQRVLLARTYMADNKFAEAEPELRQAIPVLAKSGESEKGEILPVLYMYRSVLENLKRSSELPRVQAQIDAINGWQADSIEPLTRWQGLMALENQAITVEQHIALLRQALAEAEKLPPGKPLMDTLSQLAAFSMVAHSDEAQRYYMRALEVSETVFGKESKETAGALEPLATIYESQEKFSEAEVLRKRAILILQKTGPEVFLSIAVSHLGDLYYGQKKFADAETQYLTALKVDEERKDNKDFNVSFDAKRLGRLYTDWGKYQDSLQYYYRALEIDAKQYGPEDQRLLMTLQQMGELERKLNQPALAKEYDAWRSKIIEHQIAINSNASASK